MLKPYESYKETDYDWIETVPSHWNGVYLRNITKLSDERNKERDDLALLSVYREYGVIEKSSRDDNHNVESLDLSNYKYVNKGYLVINKMKLWQGSLGVSLYEGIVSPAYIVCKVLGNNNLYYLQFLLRSSTFKTYYNRISKGIRVGQWDSNYSDLKLLKLYLPPKEEQNQIVKFLDWKTSKINTLINAKKKQIELLKEQKQAVINKAVTKGLDDTVPMKDSGVEWLGEVPEHWEVRKLRTLTKYQFQYGANESGILYSSKEPRYIRITDIDKDGSLKIENKLSLSTCIAEPYILNTGDILFARSGATVGKSFIFKSDYEQSAFAGYLIRFKPNKDILLSDYVYRFTLGSSYQLWINNIFIQSTIQNISAEKYKNLQIAVPSINEQQEIIDYIDNITTKIDTAITKTQQEIELLTEYKISLISSVVTGKVDVRSVVVPDFEIVEDVTEVKEVEEMEEE